VTLKSNGILLAYSSYLVLSIKPGFGVQSNGSSNCCVFFLVFFLGWDC
jgi:hypothetical protein